MKKKEKTIKELGEMNEEEMNTFIQEKMNQSNFGTRLSVVVSIAIYSFIISKRDFQTGYAIVWSLIGIILVGGITFAVIQKLEILFVL